MSDNQLAKAMVRWRSDSNCIQFENTFASTHLGPHTSNKKKYGKIGANQNEFD